MGGGRISLATKMALPTLYKGAGPGTYWHTHDASDKMGQGFLPPRSQAAGINVILDHIALGSNQSSCTSFSTSYAVALSYAMSGPGGVASSTNPGYVYVVDLNQLPAGQKVTFLDPVFEIAQHATGGLAHRHNGEQGLLVEIVESLPLTKPRKRHGGTTNATVSQELNALAWAIRDAEVLLHGQLIPAAVSRDSVP